ncbi:MAG TPA: CPBP family intramembrane metalloprotease [Anaerolineaceae bacterium]|nr:CPBP family intramembrane metalloprotease [Anaerolineaceae bacterium]
MNPLDTKFWLGYLSEWLGAIAVVMIAGVSPILRKIRRIEFRFPRREATFALTLFALIFFFAFQVYSNKILDFLKTAAGAFAGGDIALRMLIAVISLLPVIILLAARGQPLKSTGWSKENTRASLMLGLLLVVLTIFLRGKFTTLLKGITPEQGSLLLVLLILCLAEETIFRGYIQLRLMSFIGTTWGWLVTAILYLLWQLPGRAWISQIATAWPEILITLVQALLLGWIMRKTYHVAAPALFRAVAAWLMFI